MISVFVGTFSLATWLLVFDRARFWSDARADAGTNTVGIKLQNHYRDDIVASTSCSDQMTAFCSIYSSVLDPVGQIQTQCEPREQGRSATHCSAVTPHYEMLAYSDKVEKEGWRLGAGAYLRKPSNP